MESDFVHAIWLNLMRIERGNIGVWIIEYAHVHKLSMMKFQMMESVTVEYSVPLNMLRRIVS